MEISSKITTKFLNRSDGLPSGQIHDIAQDSNNVFWFAGPNGLAKYDGARIKAFQQKDGLATQGLRSVAVSKDGRVWVGSDVGVDVIEPDGGIHPLVGVGEWKSRFAESIAISQDETVWLGTSEGLLNWTKQNGLQTVKDSRLNSGLITSLLISKNGKIWAGGVKGGLLKCVAGEWLSPKNDDWQEVGAVLSIADSYTDDTVFVGGENGVVQIDADGRVIRRLGINISEAVTAILNVEDELWLGIGGQLRVYKSVGKIWHLEQVILENALVNKSYLDSIGNIWAATDSYGVVKISTLRKAIIQPILPKSKAVFTISQTPDGQFLLGGDQCSWKLDLREKLTAERIESLDGIKVWDIIEDRERKIWAATETGLQSISENGDTERIGAKDPVLSSPGRVLSERSDSIWIGTVSGLVEYKNGEFEQINDDKGQSLGYVYTLAEDLEKNIWIGTLGNGLWCETENGLEKVTDKAIKPFGNIYDIEISKSGVMAVLQDNKIVIMSSEGVSAKVIETEDSVAGWSALWSGDSLWVGSSSGLHEYDPKNGRELRRITALTGVAEWEFTTSRSLTIDKKGRLLCGLNGGLTIVDIEELEAFSKTPTVKLAHVNWSNAIVEEDKNGGGYIVAPGKWTLDVEAYIASFIDEGDTWVRFRLVGFDRSWQKYEKGARIQYNSLPSGSYILEAQSYIPLVGEGPITKLFDLQVQQPWWSKGWFALPYAASEAVLGLLEARWRNRRLLERNLRLEERVIERTREIETANETLQTLNKELMLISTTDSLTGIANRRQFNEIFDKELKRAQRANSYLSLIIMDVDHFKAYNDNYGHLKGDECLHKVAQIMNRSFRSGGDFLARYGGEEFAAILPATDEQGALAIAERIRTSIENVQITHKHSSAADFLTLSLGVSTFKFERPASTEELNEIKEKLIQTADKALYEAKESGRNQVKSRVLTR